MKLVVIVGIGDIGRRVAETLSSRTKTELVLVDIDEKKCERLAADFNAMVLAGDGTDPEILKKARLTEADALVATTNSDALNMVVAMLGHRMQVKKIIVKLNDLGLRPACQEIGVSKIIAPKISAAAEIYAALAGFEHLDLTMFEQAGLQLVELEVGPGQARLLSELDLPDGILVLAVRRGSRVLVPRGKTRLEENDVLLVLLEEEELLAKLKKALEIT